MSPTASTHRWCEGCSLSGDSCIFPKPVSKGYTFLGNIDLGSIEDAGAFPDLFATLPEEDTILEEAVQKEYEEYLQVPDWIYMLTDAQIDEYFGIQHEADLQEWNWALPQANGEIEGFVPTEHEGDLPELNPTTPQPNARSPSPAPIRREEDLPESNTTPPEPATLPQPRLTSVRKRKRGSPPAQEEDDEAGDEGANDEDLPAQKYPKRGIRAPQRGWTDPEMAIAATLMASAVQRRDALGLKHSEKMYGDIAQELTNLGYTRTPSSFKNYWCRTGREDTGIDERQKARTSGTLVTSARNPTKKSKSKSKTKAPESKAKVIKSEAKTPKSQKR